MVDALEATYLCELPHMILQMSLFALCPLLFAAYHLAWVAHSWWTQIPPTLKDMTNRYHEAGRRLRTESTQDDRDRYYLIYCFDATFLYLMLSLCCGIVAHEALGRTNFTTPVADDVNKSKNNAGGDSLDALLNPLYILTHGVLPRLYTSMHRPWNSLFHWIFGYLIAGIVTAIESQLITPVFAPGCNLVYFRAISISEELSTFRFMLIQLFDVHILHGISHCVKLFATYCPLVFISVWSMTNSLRLSFSLGNVVCRIIDDHFDGFAGFIRLVLSGAINDKFNEYSEHVSMLEMSTRVINFIATDVVNATLAALRPSASPAIGDWSVVWPSPGAVASTFWLSFVLVVVSATAFYFLPYQYLLLRRFLPLAKALARRLSLYEFLFDETQLQNVDRFMEVSSQLPIQSDNVVELPTVRVPISQTALRRERFLAKEKIPRFHELRIFVFVHVLLLKALLDWVWEVCVTKVLLWSLASAALRKIPGADSAFSGSLSILQLVRVFGFDMMILFWNTIGVEPIADFLSAVADYLLGPPPLLIGTWSVETRAGDNNASACFFSSTTAGAGRGGESATTAFALCGFFVLSLGLVVCLVKYSRALAVAGGYVLVTPLALVFGIVEIFKPAYDNVAGTVESIWRSAFGVQRVVVPNHSKNQPHQERSTTTQVTGTFEFGLGRGRGGGLTADGGEAGNDNDQDDRDGIDGDDEDREAVEARLRRAARDLAEFKKLVEQFAATDASAEDAKKLVARLADEFQ